MLANDGGAKMEDPKNIYLENVVYYLLSVVQLLVAAVVAALTLFVVQSFLAFMDIILRALTSSTSYYSHHHNSIDATICEHRCKTQIVHLWLSYKAYEKEPKAVFITGSFVEWEALFELNEIEKGVFHLALRLPQGHHRFRFVVDGYWFLDDGYRLEADGDGELHNVIHA